MKDWNAEHCSDEIPLEKFPLLSLLFHMWRALLPTLVVSQERGLHALSHGMLAEGAGWPWSILLIVSLWCSSGL